MAHQIDPELENKVVLVTGANNPMGIGAAVARAFVLLGSRVFLHGFRVPNAATAGQVTPTSPGEALFRAQQSKSIDEVLGSMERLGGRVLGWEADLAQPGSIPAMFDEAERAFAPVEILVNNAAHWEEDTFVPTGGDLPNKLYETWTAPPTEISAGSIDRLFAVNTRAVALSMSEFGRRHATRGAGWGRIINVSTDGAYCFPSEVSYGASKLALEAYSRSAALELAQFGVTVNVVSLGPIQTGWISRELEEKVLARIPLGRLGAPDDVADVVVFLASHQARWVTGQRIHVGGGSAM